MKSLVLAAFVLHIAGNGYAQTWQAVVLPPGPGLAFTSGTGAGDRAFAGHGLPTGTTDPAATRAVLFTSTLFRDVTPAGFRGAFVRDSQGRQHVGGATELAGPATHAILWNGSFAVDLHPTGYRASEALGVGGGFQAGFVDSGSQRQAALWHGSAGSLQILDTTGYGPSQAEGTDGTQHVGWALYGPSSWPHALLWNGLGPPIDLNPPGGYVRSIANAVDGGMQVGNVLGGATVDEAHAALWLGSAGTFRDLHPPGWVRSTVLSVRAGLQAGFGVTFPEIFRTRALVWQGDAASAVDLHALLPAEYQPGSSFAEDVNARSEIVGSVTLSGVTRPVVWFR